MLRMACLHMACNARSVGTRRNHICRTSVICSNITQHIRHASRLCCDPVCCSHTCQEWTRRARRQLTPHPRHHADACACSLCTMWMRGTHSCDIDVGYRLSSLTHVVSLIVSHTRIMLLALCLICALFFLCLALFDHDFYDEYVMGGKSVEATTRAAIQKQKMVRMA